MRIAGLKSEPANSIGYRIHGNTLGMPRYVPIKNKKK